jgi:predicted esterase
MKEFYRFYSGVFLCLSLSLFSLRGLSQVQTPRKISTSANSQGFYEYLPAGYNPAGTQTYPLLITIHGTGELGTNLSQLLSNGPQMLVNTHNWPGSFTVNGSTFSFIVISPQFIEWPEATDLDAVINYAISNYRVDVHRIYLTGLSMGGAVAWGYPGTSLAYANKIAAIVPISGAIGLNDQFAQNIASSNLPVYATHNIDDPEVPYTFTVANVNAVNGANPPPAIKAVYTIFPAGHGHDAWTTTYNPSFTSPDIGGGNLNIYQWMLQFTRSTGTPLPITLTSFTATLSQDASQVQISWATAMEMNNKYFILQRSGDGKQFTGLDTIPSTGQSGGDQYSYTDPSPLAGNNFYRLSQVDLDGKVTDYGIREVTVAATPGSSTFRLSPNPVSSTLNLELTQPEQGPLEITLSDVQGRTLRAWKSQKTGALWSQSIDVSNLPKGTYFIRIKGTNFRTVQQFLK